MGTPLAQDIGDSLQNTLDQVASVGLKVILFLIILLVGWFIARIIRNVVDRLLDRVGLNRLAQRYGMDRWTGRYRASELAARLIYYAILLIVLQLCFGLFGPNPISDMIRSIIAWLPKLFVAVIIVVVAVAIARAVFDLLSNALSQQSYGRPVARFAQIAIIFLGAVAALNQIGVATTVTTPVLITILATIGGVIVVGIGGGLVGPMRERWERILNRVEAEGAAARGNRPATGGPTTDGPATTGPTGPVT
ncbi:MAG TPA: hypothetical protein VIL37_09950 [Natronosporangium sp.]